MSASVEVANMRLFQCPLRRQKETTTFGIYADRPNLAKSIFPVKATVERATI